VVVDGPVMGRRRIEGPLVVEGAGEVGVLEV
jgi:hypothetical protein